MDREKPYDAVTGAGDVMWCDRQRGDARHGMTHGPSQVTDIGHYPLSRFCSALLCIVLVILPLIIVSLKEVLRCQKILEIVMQVT
jgi:hypothetical protein